MFSRANGSMNPASEAALSDGPTVSAGRTDCNRRAPRGAEVFQRRKSGQQDDGVPRSSSTGCEPPRSRRAWWMDYAGQACVTGGGAGRAVRRGAQLGRSEAHAPSPTKGGGRPRGDNATTSFLADERDPGRDGYLTQRPAAYSLQVSAHRAQVANVRATLHTSAERRRSRCVCVCLRHDADGLRRLHQRPTSLYTAQTKGVAPLDHGRVLRGGPPCPTHERNRASTISTRAMQRARTSPLSVPLRDARYPADPAAVEARGAERPLVSPCNECHSPTKLRWSHGCRRSRRGKSKSLNPAEALAGRRRKWARPPRRGWGETPESFVTPILEGFGPLTCL